MRATLLLALLALAFAQEDFYLCEVLVPSFCASTTERQTCMSQPALTLKGNSYSLTDNFNVISFGDMNAPSSDTEGRIAVRNNVHFSPDAYSVGAVIWSKGVGATDNVLPYSAVVGGDCNWVTGECHPTGDDYPTAAYAEQLFVGGQFTTSLPSLSARRDANSGVAAHFNDAEFDAAQNFYAQVQNYFDQIADNIQITVQYTTMTITCPSGASSYNGHIDTADFNTVLGVTFSNCDATVPMVITIGTASETSGVTFTGGSWDASQRKPERTVLNVMGSGRVISVHSTQVVGNLLAPNNILKGDGSFIQGITIVGNITKSGQMNRVTCVRPAPPVNNPLPCVSFEATCAGTLFTAAGTVSSPATLVASDTRDFNLISFGNYIANTGDIQGRAMVRNNVMLGNGYSIGYTLSTLNNLPDRHETFGLIAGGDCTWGSGALYPDGTNSPNAGSEEYIYCGKSFSSPQADLQARYAGECGAANAGCMDSIFDAAKSCYDSYSTNAANQADNTVATIANDALTITCADDTLTNYVISITDVQMTQYTYTILNNCNFQAEWIVNIRGTGDVHFSGDTFPAPPGSVLFNVIGSRTVYVNDINLNGHLLATNAVLNQTGGVIVGKTVVGDVVMALQINSQSSCQNVTDVLVPFQSGNQVTLAGSNTLYLSASTLRVDDVIDSSYITCNAAQVTAINGNEATFNCPTAQAIGGNVLAGKAIVKSNTNRANVANQSTSSASAVSVSVALIALIALLF